MMLRSSDNTDQNNEEYHNATKPETPSRSQLPRMLSMTQAEFDEQVAEAIRAQSQNLTTSSTANRPNVATPNRLRRGSHTEEATPLRQTSAEVSASGLAYNVALESVLELKRLKLDLVLTTSSEIESIKQNQISTTTVGSNKRYKDLDNMLYVVGLYPIAMGTRREPVPTRQNPSGYSEPTTSENRDGTFNYVSADDVTRWAHDKKRLYNVMLNAFHESTYAPIPSLLAMGLLFTTVCTSTSTDIPKQTSTDTGAFHRTSRALRLLVLKRIWSSLQRQ